LTKRALCEIDQALHLDVVKKARLFSTTLMMFNAEVEKLTAK
jgi:hypothetical protein